MHYKEFSRKKKRQKGQFDFQKKQQLCFFGEGRKLKRQIYDKMRDSDVNSSRRQEVCEHAVAFICPRLQLLGQATSVA